MALHDQGRALALGSLEVRVGRRVVQRVGCAGAARELDLPGKGGPGGIERVVGRALDHPCPLRRAPDLHSRVNLGAARGEDQPVAEGAQVGEAKGRELQTEVLERVGAGPEHAQPLDGVLGANAPDRAVGEKGVGGAAEQPLRVAELRSLVGQLRVLGVEVPEAVTVRHEMQLSGRAPVGLPKRLAGAAGHQAHFPRSLERGDPQLAPVPGHVRMVPAGVAQHRAIGARARAGIEVAPRGQHPRGALAVGAEGDDLVHGLAVPVGFAYAHERLAVRRNPAVGVPHRARLGRRRGDRSRLGARFEPVQALVVPA